jgi:transposase InsO family protein
MTGEDSPDAAAAAAKAAAEKEKGSSSSGAAPVAARQIRDVGAAQFPMLTRTNYAEWSTIMKVMLRGRGLWAAVTTGPADEQEDLLAMEAILKAVPPELVTPLGSADDATAKKAWEKLKTMRLGDERIRDARAQQLRRQYDSIAFRDNENVEEFALRLQALVSQLAVLGEAIEEKDVVKKYLRIVPEKYEQVAVAMEVMLDIKGLSIEEVTGRLTAAEDRFARRAAAKAARTTANGELLLTSEEWIARSRKMEKGEFSGSGSGGSGGGGRGHGKPPTKKKGSKPAIGKDQCRRCGKTGHWAKECPVPRKVSKEEVHLAAVDDDEATLLMATFCALHDVEPEAEQAAAGAEEVPGRDISLNEPRAQVHLGTEGGAAEKRWYLDSGASNHMTGVRTAFSELDTGITGSVKFGDGSRVEIRGRGTVVFRCLNGEHRALTDVYYIPRLRSSIVSLGQLDEHGCKIKIEDGVLDIRDPEHRLLAKVRRTRNRLFLLDLKIEQPVCLAAQRAEEPWLWHARFGHLGFDALGRLGKMVRGLPRIKHAGELCDSCLAGKQRRLPFPKTAKFRATDVLELVHGDLCGPITPATHGGRRYFLLLVDDSSRYMWLRLISTKDEAPAAIKHFQARAEAESGKKLRVLRTDRGGEFTSVEFAEYCAEKGVVRHLTAPYSPQQNGVVERRNQTIVGMARSMLKAKTMPAAFWGEAVSTAVFILNRSPTKALKDKTPYEVWHGRRPNVSFLRTFGCVGHVKNTKPNLGKLDDRSTAMVFLGYQEGSKAYRMYDPRAGKVVVSRDVVFDEMAAWDWEDPGTKEAADSSGGGTFTIEYTLIPGGGDAETEQDSGAAQAVPAEDAEAAQSDPPSPGAESVGAWSPAGENTPPQGSPTPAAPASPAGTTVEFASPPSNIDAYVDAFHDGEEVRFRTVDSIVGDTAAPGLASRILDDAELLLTSAEEPPTFAEAEREANWRKAMAEEMRSIEENSTWELVDPPAGCRPIGLKWVFKVKRDEHGAIVKYKARLVARGFVQREGIDFEEVFAPVARMESVRLLLALAAANGWDVHHLDVKSAFLNGDLAETVYVKQAPGFVKAGAEHKVLRLRKALYGLRQAPRAWNAKLDATLRALGFTRCETEHALYVRRRGKFELIVGVYVDDLIVTGARTADIVDFKRGMANRFRMSDLGALSYYLGIEVKQGDSEMRLRQKAYAEKLVERAGMAGCKPCATPMEERLKLSRNSTATKVDAKMYRSIVGGLRYLTHTRPDIAYAVGYVSRFMEDPREDHWTAVKRLLRYIKGTAEQGIVFPRGGDKAAPRLIIFSDADMAGDIDGRRSTSGVLVFLGPAPISWQSLKQKIVALSTCEAEYVAAATGACQGVWLRRLLEEIAGAQAPPMLRVDNQPAIALAKNPVLHDRSKHIDVKFHFLRSCVDEGKIVIEFVDTNRQLADILTKSLGRLRFSEMKKMIGMVAIGN